MRYQHRVIEDVYPGSTGLRGIQWQSRWLTAGVAGLLLSIRLPNLIAVNEFIYFQFYL